MNVADKNRNIAEARALVEAYYSGDITPEELTALPRMLEKIDSLPADLASELRMLQLLESANSMWVDTIEVPEGLEASLRLNLHRQAATERNAMGRKRLRMAMRWCGAAVVVFGIGMTWHLSQNDMFTTEVPSVVALNTPQMKTSIVEEATPSVATSSQLPKNVSPKRNDKGSDETNSVMRNSELSTGRNAAETVESSEMTSFDEAEQLIGNSLMEIRQVAGETLLVANQDLDILTMETMLDIVDARNAMIDGPDNPDDNSNSEIIIEP